MKRRKPSRPRSTAACSDCRWCGRCSRPTRPARPVRGPQRLAVDERLAPAAGPLDQRAFVVGRVPRRRRNRPCAALACTATRQSSRSASSSRTERPAACCVRLRDEPIEQLVGELGDVGQLRPRPGQRRAELGHEVTHAGLAAGDPVGEERPHEAPAQPGAEADGVVDLLDRGHAVVDQPERLAPQRLEQPVGDEPVDLRAAAAAVASRRRRRPSAARSTGRGDVSRSTDHLDQRQQVHGVERMADDKPLGVVHLGLQLGWQQARGRRREHHRRPGRGPAGGEQRLASAPSARGALLHEVDAVRCLLR